VDHFDAAGDLFGTTSFGGDLKCNGFGCRVVFELTPMAGQGWTEKLLHVFNNDNGIPLAGLIFDASHNLYGTTNGGSGPDYGTVFEIIH
jgi:hypothetical protein